MRHPQLNKQAQEAISEAAYQLATCQENDDQGGIRSTLAILQAIANVGTKATREEIRAELAAYAIPLSALQIGTEEGLDL
ncbi:hypothetical protein QUA20_31270 [Microcoleus sp. Pol7_A1]|uniref:hypothetical protein n=2 Tax=Microcoleus TaxID=44471 RepID=UPI002FD50B32